MLLPAACKQRNKIAANVCIPPLYRYSLGVDSSDSVKTKDPRLLCLTQKVFRQHVQTRWKQSKGFAAIYKIYVGFRNKEQGVLNNPAFSPCVTAFVSNLLHLYLCRDCTLFLGYVSFILLGPQCHFGEQTPKFQVVLSPRRDGVSEGFNSPNCA